MQSKRFCLTMNLGAPVSDPARTDEGEHAGSETCAPCRLKGTVGKRWFRGLTHLFLLLCMLPVAFAAEKRPTNAIEVPYPK